MMQTLTVDLGARSYPIHIGQDLLKDAADHIPLDLAGRKIFILSDRNVQAYAADLEKALAGKTGGIFTFVIDGGEQAKSMARLDEVLDWMLEARVDRHSVLFAVGGGVIGDLGGFAASVVMRGIPYVQVPTTLLSQVDSSVGGKTGINSPRGKNLIGSFYQPVCVLCDTQTLKTLPERELKAGYAEIVKYGLINKPAFFDWLESNGEKVLALEPEALTHAILTSCQDKAEIVAADERESGQRALLNLGHTFGHAFEASAGYDGTLLHGEGVSIGMVCAFALSVKMGLCPEGDLKRMQAHLSSTGLKTSLDGLNLKDDAVALYTLMLGDKKMDRGVLKFILVRGIGQAFVSGDVKEEDVLSVLNEAV